MTPYILAIGALAWALAWARRRDRLAGDQTVKTDKERQNRKTRHFAKGSTTHKKHNPIAATHSKKHGSTLRHTTEHKNERRKD